MDVGEGEDGDAGAGKAPSRTARRIQKVRWRDDTGGCHERCGIPRQAALPLQGEAEGEEGAGEEGAEGAVAGRLHLLQCPELARSTVTTARLAFSPSSFVRLPGPLLRVLSFLLSCSVCESSMPAEVMY